MAGRHQMFGGQTGPGGSVDVHPGEAVVAAPGAAEGDTRQTDSLQMSRTRIVGAGAGHEDAVDVPTFDQFVASSHLRGLVLRRVQHQAVVPCARSRRDAVQKSVENLVPYGVLRPQGR